MAIAVSSTAPRIRSIAQVAGSKWLVFALENSIRFLLPELEGVFQRVVNRPIYDQIVVAHCCQRFELTNGGFLRRQRLFSAPGGIVGFLNVLSRWDVGPGRPTVAAALAGLLMRVCQLLGVLSVADHVGLEENHPPKSPKLCGDLFGES